VLVVTLVAFSIIVAAARLISARVAFSRQGVTCYGCSDIPCIVWNRGCNNFELVSLGVAGINAAGTGKRAWVEVDELTTLSFVTVVPALARCSRETGGVVRREKEQ
jgi:hypothetical protein